MQPKSGIIGKLGIGALVNSQQSTGASALGGFPDLKQLAFNSQQSTVNSQQLILSSAPLFPLAQRIGI
jgi:hypothetical protein